MSENQMSNGISTFQENKVTKQYYIRHRFVVIGVLFFVGIIGGILIQKILISYVNKKIVIVANASVPVMGDSALVSGTIVTVDPDSTTSSDMHVKKLMQLEKLLISTGMQESDIDFRAPEVIQQSTSSAILSPNNTNKTNSSSKTLDKNGFTRYSTHAVIFFNKENLSLVDNIVSTVKTIEGAQFVYAQYSIADGSSAAKEVRRKALENARHQAENIAKINHAKIVRLDEINDQNIPYYTSDYPINTGRKEMTLSATYRVVYELNTPYFPF